MSLMKHALIISAFILLNSLLYGCASSEVSRQAASNMDMGVQNVNNMTNNATNSSFSETVQNSSHNGAVLAAPLAL